MSNSSLNKKPRQSSLPPLRVNPCTPFTPPKSPKSPSLSVSSGPQIEFTKVSPQGHQSPYGSSQSPYYSVSRSPTPKSPNSSDSKKSHASLQRQHTKSQNFDYGDNSYASSPRSPVGRNSYYIEQKSPVDSAPRSPISAKPNKIGRSEKGNYCQRPERPQSVNFAPQKSPKSPRQISFKSPNIDENTPQNGSDNYFNFNVVSPNTSKRAHPQPAKTYSQSEYFERKKCRGEYKTVLTKTQSEPKSTVTFEVNSKKFDLKSPPTEQKKFKRKSSEAKAKTKNCNIRTNPGYQPGYGSNTSINLAGNHSSDEEATAKNFVQRCRKSTSDLTDMTDDCNNTTLTSLSRPSSPRRRGSIKGGLAYLASRRGSRDSNCSNVSNVSNEDIGPLNFQNTARGRQRRTSNFLELPVPDHIRPRVCSLPEKAYNPRLSDDLYRLRTFSITNKGGVVNCGDSIINRRSRSNTSVNSNTSRQSALSNNGSPFDGASSCCSAYHAVGSSSPGSSPGSPPEDEIDVPRYRVVLLGESGVGKTALVSQFMTSEYMNTYDASLDDEFGEKTVSILLDGEESEMIFIDHPSVEMSVENSLSTYEPHACVVVYSIVARESFKVAEDILNYLWQENYTHDKSVIVVGNKADLARSRVISANDGKALAVSRDCKFIETSSGIQHNVDELLVGILKQIRLRECRDKKKESKKDKKLHGSKTSLSLNIAREILQKMCLNDISKSKSCENLHVL